MTSTEQTRNTSVDRDEYETDVFEIGEPCGVCRFPIGRGQICGNVVYANNNKGRLPWYCGQEGQAEWQKRHGTPGAEGHRSDLATYPRKKYGMNKEEVAALARAEAARRGITRRLKVDGNTTPTAALITESVTETAAPIAPGNLADALPESPVEALAELARLVAGRVVAVREEMDTVRAAAEARAAEIEAENAARTEELDAMRAELENDRAEAQEITERAKSEIRAAEDARLHAVGELSAAQKRIAELEAALAAAEARRIEEVEQVRRTEREEFRLAMREFAATVRGEKEPAREATPREVPITEEVMANMVVRIERGEIDRRGAVWHVANAAATRPTAQVLDHMQEAGYLRVGTGNPAPVTVTNAYRQRPR